VTRTSFWAESDTGFKWAVTSQELDRSYNYCFNTQKPNNEVAIMENRTEYVERISAQMVEWDVQIDLLKDKAESASSEAKSEYSKAISALKLKRDEAAQKLQGVSSAGDDEWEEIKTGTEHVMDEVRTMLRDTIKKIT
jgi:hypothetical protein